MNFLNKISSDSWKYKTMGISMDGGSLTLLFHDENGHEKQLQIIQHRNLKYYKGLNDKLPGRIYLDSELIGKRTTKESQIVEYIENELFQELNNDQKEVLEKHLKFIKSEQYINNIPINTKLSDFRKKHLESIVEELKFELNPVEQKFVELREEEISIEEFEKWVYNNEKLIKEHYSQTVFDNLIILNYRSKESKYELTKILRIDYRKIELTSLNNYLDKLTNSNNEISKVNCSNSFDYRNYFFSFKLDDISIGLLNPFKLVNYHYDMDNNLRISEFKERFQNPKYFFTIIQTELNTENVRLVINEEIADVDSRYYSEAHSGTEEEIYIHIDKHRLIMNKEYLSTKMIEYWL